jgi:exo-1,4-beta-D-glucosaminidase
MRRPVFWLVAAAFAAPHVALAKDATRQTLGQGWMIQSSAKVPAKGDAISAPGFQTEGWHKAKVPNTVVGALVEDGTYPDPYFGMNLRKIPGTDYKIGERFTLIPTPDNSPFKPAWWYRTEFDVAATQKGRPQWLHFEGINYRANIWVNGTQIANSKDVVGAFRHYEFDVTPHIKAGGKNVVAVEVTGPEPHDLAFMWVDWNPTPADKNLGLWAPVYLSNAGALALRNPHVVTDLDLPSLATAKLTITAEVKNGTDRAVSGVVRGTIGTVKFSQPVSLAAKETKLVRFTPADFKELTLQKPRIWWPFRMGKPELYTLSLAVDAAGALSDQQDVRFGVVEHTSELTDKGHRLYKVNGKPILIRGGGWASDMLLRPITTERALAEMRYVKEMGLNTIRLEGKLETDEFYDLADEQGILLMPGWCCCDQWEMWDKWDAEDYKVAPLSLESQVTRMRNHPSVFVWLNGSDFPPPAKVEQAYLDVLKKVEWSKPILSNATQAPGPVTGPSGVKMKGPYDYVAPAYWHLDKENGGAFGFATEIGPGGAVPPVESLKTMLGPDHLWPIDDTWRYHAGGDEFKDLKVFTDALEGRYGKGTDVEDYARKAQALAYESHRAMFEAYGRNKYTSTGVIQWMLNNAWPSMIWHLYDYYLRPGGSYFGSKKAVAPLNVQYAYHDGSIAVVNDTLEAFKGLKLKAEVFDFGLASKFVKEAVIAVPSDGVVSPFSIPKIDGLSGTYFLRLSLHDAAGKEKSRNFYWLSTKDDEIDWKNTKWFYTPTKSHADLTALSTLPPTTLTVSAQPVLGKDPASVVTVKNTGKALAFQVRLKMVDAAGEEPLPVFWEDNYFELFPGEVRTIRVAHTAGKVKAAALKVQATAWNAHAGVKVGESIKGGTR